AEYSEKSLHAHRRARGGGVGREPMGWRTPDSCHLGNELRALRDQARATPEEHIAVDPGRQHGEPITKSDEHRDVKAHPGHPGQPAAEPKPPNLDDRARFAHGRHRAVVLVMKTSRAKLTSCETTRSSICVCHLRSAHAALADLV